MRLKRGKAKYKLPKDCIGVERVLLKCGRNLSLIYIMNQEDFERLDSRILTTPAFACIEGDYPRHIIFYPVPKLAYYCEIEYLARRKI